VTLDRRGALGAALALALAVAGYFALRPTDESLIRGKLSRLAKAVKITEADMQKNPIGLLGHATGEFEHLFEPDVRVSIPDIPTPLSTRADLCRLWAGAPSHVRTFDVDFSDVTIKLDDAHASALVGVTASVTARDRDDRRRSDRRGVDLRFAKDDGDWLITTLTVWPPAEGAGP
jgi:hypothetical protein